MSNRTFLGKVGMTPKGEWNNSTTYERLDVVSYEGSSYIAITQNRNSVPTDSNPDWMIGAKHGEFTEEQLEEFKEEVVRESKQEIDDYTDDKKAELDTYEGIKETELNTYTTTKKGEIDTHTAQKISDYNSNADTKTRAFNTNAETKTTNFNDNATSKTNAYNQNAEDKTTAFNTNAANKQTAFDNNATQKTTAFNENATSKTTDFNTNASNKQDTFDDNAEDKLDAFNQNAQQKTAEFDSHTTELEEDNENLKNALPEVTGEGSNIVLQGTSKNKYKQPPLPGGNSWQTHLTGRNKFDKDTARTNKRVNSNDGTIGDIGVSNNIDCTDYIDISNFSELYLSGNSAINNGTSYHGAFYDTNKAFISGIGCTMGQTFPNKKIDVPNNAKYFIFNFKRDDMNTIQLEEGSTATDYEPYCGGIPSPNPTYKQDIHNVSGNVENVITNKNVNTSELELGSINPDDGSLVSNNSRTRSKDFIKVKPNTTYTFQREVGQNRWIIGYTSKKVGITDGNVSNYPSALQLALQGDLSFTFTTSPSTNYIKWYDTASTNLTEKIQIEPGTTATPYVAHQSQTLPFTLSQGQKMYKGDYLADDGIHHVRGEKVFDGSVDESWSRVDSWNNFYRISIRISNAKLYTTNDRNGQLCSHFTYNPNAVTGFNLEKSIFCQFHDSNEFYFIIEQSTKDAWVEWLAQHPITLEYELAEEVIDPYTETQQEQYNAIKKAMSYKDTTIITLSSDDADPLTNVVAVADMSNFNPSEIDEIKTAIVALGGVI